MDIDRLHRELARAILDADEAATRDTAAFVRAFVAKLDVKYKITAAQSNELETWMDRGIDSLRAGIGQAVAIGGKAGAMSSEMAAQLAEEAYTRTWADGKRLSKRLWDWRKDTKAGVADALAKGIRQMQDVSGTLYDVQRAIEKETGTRFEIISSNQKSWVAELEKSARALIHDPDAKGQWNATVNKLERHINTLRVTGTKRAAERVLDQMKRAVAKGNEKLVGKAVEWWIYDKQLYCLKRIIRTEMATAQHLAIIASTEDSEDVVGYQWRLSASHPDPDICDVYAAHEEGLGPGVYSKATVPRQKAHPHCMCLLVPRTGRPKPDYSPIPTTPGLYEANAREEFNRRLGKWADYLHEEPDAMRVKMRQNAQGVADRSDVYMRVNRDSLDKMLKSGQADLHTGEIATKEWAGWASTYREKFVDYALGAKDNPPVLGYLSESDDLALGNFSLDKSGEIAVRLKPSVKQRSSAMYSSVTSVISDSKPAVIAKPMTAMDEETIHLHAYAKSQRPDTINDTASPIEYWQAHVFEGVNLGDVEYIVFPKDPPQVLQKQLKKLGLTWRTAQRQEAELNDILEF
jgi:hypothetical protein